MAEIEVLAYTPNDMDEFIAFCLDGKPDGHGGYETDGEGRLILGVLKWLHGRGVPEAHFFNSAKGEEINLFAATVEKPETYDRPWMKQIPGFDIMVKADGLVGITTKFASIESLLASIKSNTALDQEFASGKERVDTILESIRRQKGAFSFGEKEFLAALRGEKGSNPQAVFAEVEKNLGFSPLQRLSKSSRMSNCQ